MKNEPHILVVGIDGVRYDSLRSAATPALDRIADQGFLVPVRVHHKNATISGPVWATVATGVYADRHKVTGNSHHPAELDSLPDFTAALRAARPELQTMIAVSWHPLAIRSECGPIFTSRGWVPTPDPEEANDADSWTSADDAVAEYASARIRHEDLAASFVYFGEADVEAHNHGTGDGYLAAIQRCDARLNTLLDAIAARPNRAGEDWTVIVVTDHGHLDAGGHGGETEAERTAWIGADGAALPRHVTTVDHADIFPQVLATFGVAEDDTEGVIFGARQETPPGARVPVTAAHR
ncbi:alkaline phosphatase family protein [Arthrobacter sp. AK01]|uniref:alkaline phosphatase family protein n=1 Tax=Arthrobacter sp. AK01 TaxID=2894084 RepID=UPI001E553DA5|nr:alkaline phosphatase family protein [Arthrobacter sp. AK01]MCD4850566.1 alkaline phosphatase family protein [Arthrobacter sp. AK01]